MIVMKEKLNLKVSYYTRDGKEHKGESPIMLRVSLDGNRSSFGQIGLSVEAKHLSKSRVINDCPNATNLNAELNELEARIRFFAEQLQGKGRLNLENLKEELSGKKHAKQYISVLFEELIYESERAYQSGNISKGTFNRHKNYQRVFMNFIAYKYHRKDLRIDEVTRSLISDYEEYLWSVLGYCHNTQIKYMRFLNQATRKAIENGLLGKDPFSNISFTEEETDIGFLDENDLAKLMKTKITKKHLEFVRDVFVFSCFTGLSYSDVSLLTNNNRVTMNGTDWLLIRRKKTNGLSQIPLLPQALDILDKYKDYETSEGRLLPVPCNQVINRQLKEVQALCGIQKKLTYHLSRHTFATLALTKGVSLETVNKILGHKKLTTTQIYAKVITPKISYEMNAFNNRLQQERNII